jgi:hypothetical protein
MAVTPLPFLDRTAATFKTDTDTFFGSQLPQFSVEVNQVAADAQASATAANSSKTAAATSATNAASSATAANTSKTNAATSETNAAASKTAAASSATDAASSATAANTSKNAAATSATNAATSASQAAAAAASIADGPVTSVNGKTGVVALVKADVGLSLVDNVSMQSRGLGAGVEVPYITNLDDLGLTNGWYGVSSTTTGAKPNPHTWGVVMVSGRIFRTVDTRTSQTFYAVDNGAYRTYGRNCAAGVWTNWAEITLPALTGNARKPLTPGDAATAAEWSDTLSISKYIDKMLFYGTSAASFALDISRATVFDITLSVNTTFTLSNMPSLSGESLTLVIRVRQAAVPKTITWFAGITWLTYGGVVPPTPGANQIIEYVLSTTGTGATWVGRVGAST